MQALGFSKIAALISYSRTMHIEPEPSRDNDDGWAMFDGEYRLPTKSSPFRVVYIRSAITASSLSNALEEARRGSDVHVVYPESVLERHPRLKRELPESVLGFTTREYLQVVVRDELATYTEAVQRQQPAHYTDPPVRVPAGFRRRLPNPLFSLMTDDASAGLHGGQIGILLAEAGQGKTYLSSWLAARIAHTRKELLPVFVDSDQWGSLAPDDLSNLWKTVLNSFRHFKAPIGWVEHHEQEFMEVMFRDGGFRLVFDGFDEYILKNSGKVEPEAVLDNLAEMARQSGARILITSRKSFWETSIREESLAEHFRDISWHMYELLPFDQNHATNYFKSRLAPSGAQRATEVFSRLTKRAGDSLIGRGFVLPLVVDLVERGGSVEGDIGSDSGSALLWLVEALCSREEKRQRLPLTALQQLQLLSTFAEETARGEEPTTELIDLLIEFVGSNLDARERISVRDKLVIHPLIERRSSDGDADWWQFKEFQVGIVLLARTICSASESTLAKMASSIRLGDSARQDLASMLIALAPLGSNGTDPFEKIASIVQALVQAGHSDSIVPGIDASCHRAFPRRLAASLALLAVDHFAPRGRSKVERAEVLGRLFGNGAIRWATFSGPVASLDLRGIRFQRCCFDRVGWANCTFDETTLFERCRIAGDTPPNHCEGFGKVTLENCQTDAAADGLLEAARVREGARAYTRSDLRRDFFGVMNKFVSKSGTGLRTVESNNLRRGAIAYSSHSAAILEEFEKHLIAKHRIHGQREGFHIRDEVAEAAQFFAANNVLTGPIHDAFDRLVHTLKLPE